MVTQTVTGHQMMNTSPQSITTTTSALPISQSQPCSIDELYRDNSTYNKSNSNVTNTNPSTLKSNVRTVHHQNKIHYLLVNYCLPIETSLSTTQKLCKFSRNCIVTKSKILSHGDNISTLSPTVFGKVPGTLKKLNYIKQDIRNKESIAA